MKHLLKKLFKRTTEPIIVVSGLPRSGTSMMMKMLEAGGIPPLTDELRKADEDNPKGYYEFERVKELKNGDAAWLPQARGKAVKVISALLPYLPDQHAYKIIFMNRRIGEILASQRKMLINRDEDPDSVDDRRMEILFEKHLRQTQTWLTATNHVTHILIDYHRVIADPASVIEGINDFLGGSLHLDRMGAVVDPDLYRQRRS